MDKIGFMITKNINGILNGKWTHGRAGLGNNIEGGNQVMDGKIIRKCGHLLQEQKIWKEEALPEFPKIDSIWYYYWLEENENKDIEELYLLMENDS